MFPTGGGSNPEAAAERARQEQLAAQLSKEGIEALPGVKQLRQAREDERRERAEAERQKVADREASWKRRARPI